MALIASLTHPQSRVVLTSFRSGTCSCLKSLNDKESYVVSRTAPVGPLGYVAMNEIDHFARTQVPATAHRSHQTIAPTSTAPARMPNAIQPHCVLRDVLSLLFVAAAAPASAAPAGFTPALVVVPDVVVTGGTSAAVVV